MTEKTGFRRWHEAGFTADLLPIIPVNARLTDGTSVKPHHLGKVPGVLTPATTWSGLGGKWSDDLTAGVADCIKWTKWGASVGLQARTFVGLDIDVDDGPLAAAIQSFAEDYLGLAPVRTRANSARRLMMYRAAEPMRKVRQPFGDKQAVELLAKGQQFVVEGLHAAGGEYAWDGQHPCDIGAGNIPVVTGADIERFFGALGLFLGARGLALGKMADPSAALTTGTRRPLTDPSLWAPSPHDVTALLLAWRPAELAHDAFIAAVAAIKASFGPDYAESYYGDVLEWAPGARSGEDEATRKVWDSITDAAVGWDWLVGVAGQGATAAQADFDDGAAAPVADEYNTLESMLSRYVYAVQQGRYYDLETGDPLTADGFNAVNTSVAHYGRSGVQSAAATFQNTVGARKVSTVTYRPGSPALVDEVLNGVSRQTVNLWRPSALVPAAAATDEDVKPWLSHVSMLFGEPGDPAREHILNYLAFILQHPGEKINHAPVILSNMHGIGKDTMLVPFLAALGPHNYSTVGPDELLAPFNPWIERQFIVVNEVLNFHKKEITNKLKPLLASPPHFLLVNKKNIPQYYIPNLPNVLMFTNYDDAISIDAEDRRFWVHRCLTDEALGPDYFMPLYAWYKAGGSMLIARWLLDRDLTGFNPKDRPAMTEAKRDMIEIGIPAATRWLADEFKVGNAFNGREIVAAFELVAHAKHAFNSPAGPCTHMHAVEALKRAGYRSTDDKYRVADGKIARLWTRGRVANNAAAVLKAYEADVKSTRPTRA